MGSNTMKDVIISYVLVFMHMQKNMISASVGPLYSPLRSHRWQRPLTSTPILTSIKQLHINVSAVFLNTAPKEVPMFIPCPSNEITDKKTWQNQKIQTWGDFLFWNSGNWRKRIDEWFKQSKDANDDYYNISIAEDDSFVASVETKIQRNKRWTIVHAHDNSLVLHSEESVVQKLR